MTLSQKQQIFAKNVGKLIAYAFDNGYALTFGEAYRPQEMQDLYMKQGKTKAAYSQHTQKLAVDFNLFVGGVYKNDTPSYQKLGAYWMTLHPLNRWGGDWDRDGSYKDEKFLDGNHFEMQ